MKDKKILVLIAFAAVLLGVLLFVSRPVTKHKVRGAKQEAGIVKLREQIRQAESSIQSFAQINVSLKNNLNTKERQLHAEKERSQNLGSELKEAVLQNEILNEELTLVRASLVRLEQLTQPIRIRLEGLENTFEGISVSLAALGFSPESEKRLRKQLSSLSKELDSIDRKIPRLIKENKNYQKEAEILENRLSEKDIQMQNLENRLSVKQRELKQLINARLILGQSIGDLQKRNASLEKELEQGEMDKEELNRLKKDNFILEQALNSIKRKNSLLNKRITKLKGDGNVLSSLRKINRELKKQSDLTKAELKKLSNDYVSLKDEYESVKGNLAKNEMELARRAERILGFQDRLAITEEKIEQLQNDSVRQKEETAGLRKQYVARQLEKQILKGRLNQYKQKLADLQTQIIQATKANSMLQDRMQEISKIFKRKETSGFSEVGASKEAGARKVDVELIPKIGAGGEE